MTLSDMIASFRRERGCSPRVGFIGLGVSNRALVSEACGCDVTLRDAKGIDAAALPDGFSARAFAGENYLSDICEDILVASPSFRRDAPELLDAIGRGTTVTSDAELFFEGREASDYLVTGSDGKSTTATLAAMLLSEKNPGIETVGNIGRPFARSRDGTVVAELSSFQLSYVTPPSRAAVITTITPNHLNWHSSLDEYIEAKLNIARRTERLALSPDSALEEKIIEGLRPAAIYSTRLPLSELVRKYRFAEDYLTLERGKILCNGSPLIDSSLVRRSEEHNLHNLMGAISLALGEFSEEQLYRVAKDFSGLAHRMEFFLTAGGVDFINSSIDTTPARTRVTLLALDRPVRIILGGGSKGLSIGELLPALSKYATRVAFYGKAGAEYASELVGRGEDVPFSYALFEGFDEALGSILRGACRGDTVLLSPAATGYGEFRDYSERGNYFKEYIKKLYSDRA